MKWPGTTRLTSMLVHPHLPVFLWCTETGVVWTHYTETLNFDKTNQSRDSAQDMINKLLAREAMASVHDEMKLVAEGPSTDDQTLTSVALRQVQSKQYASIYL